jgi:transposase
MTHLSGHDRSQLLLLPEAVDDYVGPDNAVRFIDAFVDGLDLAAASFIHVEPKVTGRPGYAPADLLKLYISRRSAEALHLRLSEPGAVEPSAGG